MNRRKRTAKSKVHKAVHDTARDLHKLGFIDRRKMEQYEVLCLKAVPEYSSKRIQALRKRYNISQAVLAAILNTSSSTVQKWEIGEKQPSGPSLKLLHLLDTKGLEALI